MNIKSTKMKKLSLILFLIVAIGTISNVKAQLVLDQANAFFGGSNSASNSGTSQSFVPDYSGTLDKIELFLGYATDSVTIGIVPGNNPYDSPLITQKIDASETAYAWRTIDFVNPTYLTAGDTYQITLVIEGPGSFGFGRSGSDKYPKGTRKLWYIGNSSVIEYTDDMIFKTFINRECVNSVKNLAIANDTICGGSNSTNVSIFNSESGISYTLRDNESNAIIGSSQNGNGGTLTFPTGSISKTTEFNVTGRSDQSFAMDFDGGDDEVIIPYSNELPSTGDEMTLAFWVYPRDNSIDQIIIGQADPQATDGYEVKINGTTGELEGHFRHTFAGVKHQMLSANVNYNQWNHIAFTVETYGEIRMFHDGIEVDSTVAANFFLRSTMAYDISLGSSLIHTSDPHFNGKLDEFSIWEKTLNNAEINNLMFNPLAGGEDGLKAYFRCNQDAQTNVLKDFSGYNHHGALTNMDSLTDWVVSTIIPPVICEKPMDTTVSLVVTPIVQLDSTGGNVCFGTSNAYINLSVVSASGGVSFNWNTPNADTTRNITGVPAGIWTCTITDGSCVSELDVEVTEGAQIIVGGVISKTCGTNADGAVDITANGGAGGFMYSWDNGQGAVEDLTNVTANTYEVTVTDANLCQANAVFVVDSNPTYNLSENIEICEGNSVLIGSTFQSTAGNYPVMYSSILGCDSLVTFNLIVNPSYLFQDTIEICGGDSALIYGVMQSSHGVYSDNYATSKGCDSIYSTFLKVNALPAAPSLDGLASVEICAGGEASLSVTGTGVNEICWQNLNTPNAKWYNIGNEGFTAGWVNSTALDVHNGVPYVLGNVNGNSAVMKYEGGTWQNIGPANFAGMNISFFDIKVDKNGVPYITYYNSSISRLVVQYFDGSSWVDVGTGLNVPLTAAQGKLQFFNDTLYVGYSSSNAGQVGASVKKFNGTTWDVVGTEFFNASNAFFPDFTISDGGTPYASFQESSGINKLSVMKYEAGSWQYVGPRGISPGTISSSDIEVYNDTVYVSYRDANGPNVLKYNGATWEQVGAANFGPAGSSTSFLQFEIDSEGKMYSSFKDGANGKGASVMSYNGTSWEQVGDYGFTAGEVGAISFDIDGKQPYISYRDYTRGSYMSVMSFDTLCYSDQTSFSTAVAGEYVAYVTDANGCENVSSNQVELIVHGNPVLQIDSTRDLLCYESEDGYIETSIAGGMTSYNYNWLDASNNSYGVNNATISNATSGLNTLIVTDVNTCADTIEYTLNQPDSLDYALSTADVDCFGDSTGTGEIALSGGTAPYQYDWSNDGTTDLDDSTAIVDLKSDTYYVHFQDSNGCNGMDSIVITEQPQIVANPMSTDVLCNGDSTGTVSMQMTGGTAPLTNSWFGIDTMNVAQGTYSYQITDAFGCEASGSVMVNEPIALTSNPMSTDVLCYGDSTGMVSLNASGGSGNLVENWFGMNPTVLPAGTFNYEVTDSLGCVDTGSVMINQPDTLIYMSFISEDESSFGSDGSIDLAIAGGTFPYDVTWSNSETTEDLVALVGGIYTVQVTDSNGCIDSASVTIGSHVGIDSKEFGHISIFPNPVVNFLKVQAKESIAQVRLFDATGKLLTIRQNIVGMEATIDLSESGAGVYILEITNQNGDRNITQIIKQ